MAVTALRTNWLPVPTMKPPTTNAQIRYRTETLVSSSEDKAMVTLLLRIALMNLIIQSTPSTGMAGTGANDSLETPPRSKVP